MNLSSISQLCDLGYSVLFIFTQCYVQDPQFGSMIGTGRKQGELYLLDELKVPNVVASIVDLSPFHLNFAFSSFYLWHFYLGHVSSSRLKYLASARTLGKLQTSDISICCDFKLAKFTSFPFSDSVSMSYIPFDLIHFDYGVHP